MNTSSLIIFILIFMIIIYIYNDFIQPCLYSFVNESNNSLFLSYIKKYIFQNKLSNTQENFTQYSSLSSQSNKNNLDNTIQFDTNWYLRDMKDNSNFNKLSSFGTNSIKPIIYRNQISLPVIRYGFYSIGSYDNLVAQYFRHHIYPIETEQLITGLDTIYKFINNDIDIAFINEELLTRYIKKDCKYLTNIILDNLGLTTSKYDLSILENVERLYPPINFSAIGVGFYQDFYLIVNNFSNIIEFMDIKNKSIGILADSYYYFVKICSAYGISLEELRKNTFMIITLEQNIEDLLSTFKINKYDGIFLVAHPKNLQLLKLSLIMKMRYIHIQKKEGLDTRKILNNLIPTQQGTNPLALPPPPSINRQAIYSQTLMNDLQTENIKETFNSLIKKYFQCITPRTVDLNKFHKSGNIYSYLETFSTRMILVVRNDIPQERVKFLTQNYIDNLEKIRDIIDKEQFQIELNNFSSLEFNYQELVSFNSSIPLSVGAKDIYAKEGLIYYENDERCKL